jgi:transcriptional antiterminator RfaH
MIDSLSKKNWYVLYTKPKNEIKSADLISSWGFEVYCPVIKTVKQWSDRKKKITEPLFKSYIFVCIQEHEREIVFEAPGAVRYLFWLGKPAIVRDDEIDAIKQFLSEDLDTTKALEFEYYQDLKIVQGVLKGHQGKYLYSKKGKLVLQIESLGIVIKAEVHQSQVV